MDALKKNKWFCIVVLFIFSFLFALTAIWTFQIVLGDWRAFAKAAAAITLLIFSSVVVSVWTDNYKESINK